MPTHKDFKRVVRTRMKKTGEAYTAARAQILRMKSPAKRASLSTADFAALAGMSDEALEKKTGHPWAHWVETLDRIGAYEWTHTKIARYVKTECGVPDWWTQAVTVGYERIKGLRAMGQRRDGTFEASKSKTYAVSLSRLYAAWSTARARRAWLPDVKLTIRTAAANKSIRITWGDGTNVEAMFLGKGPSKSQVAVAHTKLKTKAEVAERKAYWEERLRALAHALSNARKKP